MKRYGCFLVLILSLGFISGLGSVGVLADDGDEHEYPPVDRIKQNKSMDDLNGILTNARVAPTPRGGKMVKFRRNPASESGDFAKPQLVDSELQVTTPETRIEDKHEE